MHWSEVLQAKKKCSTDRSLGSTALKETCRWSVFEENIWTKDKDRIRGWRKVLHEELHNFCSLPILLCL